MKKFARRGQPKRASTGPKTAGGGPRKSAGRSAAVRRRAGGVPESAAGDAVFTVGHSTRPLEEFISLLRAHGIRRLVDIRTVPRSARNPQFNRETLPKELERAGIEYRHLPGLGGLRRPRRDSINRGWRNDSFRGYADYMQTEAFVENLESLIALSREAKVAIMCAEAVPWRCHRSLVGDALLARGVDVFDIMTPKSAKPHSMTSFAAVQGPNVTYPAAELELPFAEDSKVR
jgi:uncharacterized protein (DUF488 family)